MKHGQLNPTVFHSFTMSSPFLDLQSNPISKEKVLGSGNSALVVLQNSVAVKIPLRCLWSSDSDIEGNIQSLILEKTFMIACRVLKINIL